MKSSVHAGCGRGVVGVSSGQLTGYSKICNGILAAGPPSYQMAEVACAQITTPDTWRMLPFQAPVASTDNQAMWLRVWLRIPGFLEMSLPLGRSGTGNGNPVPHHYRRVPLYIVGGRVFLRRWTLSIISFATFQFWLGFWLGILGAVLLRGAGGLGRG